jgi:hypothetical protein
MPVELHVRFGHCDDRPREVHSFCFETEMEKRAFINGMWSVASKTGDYDLYSIAETPESPDPDYEGEEEDE